jgi:hypothetical protein
VRRILIPLLALAALAQVAVGQAAAREAPAPMWATVNICDTPGSPNAMGVRASIPGDGTRARMEVRFTAQHWNPVMGDWAPVAGVPRSPWLDAGSARWRWRQVGYTFSFEPLPLGEVTTLRGVAELRWRDGDEVVRSRTRVTRPGVEHVHEGDPIETSRAVCTIASRRGAGRW